MMRKNNAYHTWPVTVLVLVGILLASGSILHTGAAAGQSPITSADQQFMQQLRQALNGGQLSETDRQALEKKLSYSERLEAQRANAPSVHGPKRPMGVAVTMPEPLETSPKEPVERIVEGSEGIVHSWEAAINNLWEGQYENVPYQVLAGSEVEDKNQGLLIVLVYSPSTGQPIRQDYRTPSPTGGLRIARRQGSRLVCSTPNRSTVYFDLLTREFQEK